MVESKQNIRAQLELYSQQVQSKISVRQSQTEAVPPQLQYWTSQVESAYNEKCNSTVKLFKYQRQTTYFPQSRTLTVFSWYKKS